MVHRRTRKVGKTFGEEAMDIIHAQLKGTLPKNVIVLETDQKDLSKLLTKRRLELLSMIQEEEAMTVNEIANQTGRKKEAISRDMHALAEWGIVIMKRDGKHIRPRLAATAIVLPLAHNKQKIHA